MGPLGQCQFCHQGHTVNFGKETPDDVPVIVVVVVSKYKSIVRCVS